MREIEIPKSFQFIEGNHKAFVSEVCKNKEVYVLMSDEGYAFSETIFIDDDNGDVIDKMLFWSNIKAVEACRIGDWSDHNIEEIDLVTFLEQWCVSLKNDDLIIGTNPTHDMVSYEIDPLDLVLEIIEQLRKENIPIKLKQFESVAELEKQAKRVLGE